MNKDVADYRRRLLAAGWELDRIATTGHYIYRWPATGETISTPSTPSDYRWLRNTDADVRRISGAGVLPERRAGRYTHKQGSGYSTDAALAERRRRDREVEALLDELDDVHDRVRALAVEPRRNRLELQHLAVRHLDLQADLELLGAACPSFPSASPKDVPA